MASNNRFTLDGISGVTSLSLQYNNDIHYTSGESFGGVTIDGNGSDSIDINVEVDRKGSEDVANWFNGQLNSDPDHMMTVTGGDDIPEKLNFAFSGQLSITTSESTETYTIYFGQGHSALGGNNWWIGSNDLENPVLATMFTFFMSSNEYASVEYGGSGVTDNKCTLISTTGLVTGISYNDDIHVPEGKAQTGVTIDSSDLGNIVIDAEAPQDAESDVADWFNSSLGGTPATMYTNPLIFASDQMPEELSFAFSVNLTLSTGAAHKVYLGQGAAGPYNNWWFGSTDLISIHKTIAGTNIDFAFFLQASLLHPSLITVSGNGSSTFYLSEIIGGASPVLSQKSIT